MANDSKLRLLTNVKIDDNNLIRTGSYDSNVSYFKTLTKGSELTGYKFITTSISSGSVIVPFGIGEIIDINYIMFINPSFGNKWYIASVEDLVYNANDKTVIVYKINPFQTFMYDIDFFNSMVEREHVTNDTIGVNLIDENLDIGDVISKNRIDITNNTDTYVIIEGTGYLDSGGNWIEILSANAGKICGSFNGLTLVYFNINDTFSILSYIQNAYDNPDANIVNLYTVPLSSINNVTQTSGAFAGGLIITETSINTYNPTVNKQYTDLDGYVPRNNKLFTYPYNFLYATNNSGNYGIYKYEDFLTTECEFEVFSSLLIGGDTVAIPKFYKGVNTNFDESIVLTGFPLCGWSYDTYTAWLSQNLVSNTVGLFTGVVGVAGSVATQNPLGIVSSVGSLANTIGSFREASLQPQQVRGGVTSNLNMGLGSHKIVLHQKTIKHQYAKLIDEYFTRYGYKVLLNKVPNLDTRSNWNYVKLIDVNISANIPKQYLDIIKTQLINGVTFWHTGNIGNYSLSNN